MDVFLPTEQRTKSSSKIHTGYFGWVPWTLVPFSPAMHALWWWHKDGGRDFISQLEDATYVDEDDITSPEADVGIMWPWEKWGKPKPKQMQRKDFGDGICVVGRVDELDVMTPTWQRYYDRALDKIGRGRGESNSDAGAAVEARLPPVEDWEDRPIYVRLSAETHLVEEAGLASNSSDKKSKKGMKKKLGLKGVGVPWASKKELKKAEHVPSLQPTIHPSIPLNKRGKAGFVSFSTPTFSGSLSFAVADLPGSEVTSIFAGRKRRYRYVVTGRFNRRVRFDRVYTGQIIRQTKDDKGTNWLMKSLRWMLKSLSPAMREMTDGGGNKVVVSPVAATAQKMCVRPWGEGDGMDDDALEVDEDLRILGPHFRNRKGLSLPSETRKKMLTNEAELQKHWYEPGLTYTFEFYQHLFDPVSFQMNIVGITTFDVANVLGPQPIRIMAKIADPDGAGDGIEGSTNEGDEGFLWDLEMYHERSRLHF